MARGHLTGGNLTHLSFNCLGLKQGKQTHKIQLNGISSTVSHSLDLKFKHC